MSNNRWDSGGDPPMNTFSRGGRRGGRGRGNFDRSAGDRGRYNGFRGRGGGRGRRGSDQSFRGNETSCTVMQVCSSSIGKIIGKGGSKIRELQTDSGADIEVEKTSDSNLAEIMLRGSKESQAKAKELINMLLADSRGRDTNTSFYGDSSSKHNNSGGFSVIPSRRSDENGCLGEKDFDEVNRLHEERLRNKWTECPPIKKEFYEEDPEIKNMDPELVENIRKDKQNIVVNHIFGECGETIPHPILTFEQAFASYPDILELISQQQFKEPTPIQCQAWPILLSGKDMVGIAQTGTGKTLAFLLPALIHLEGQPLPCWQTVGANILVMVPTRELAQQIQNEVNNMYNYSYREIKSTCIYGGENIRDQLDDLKRGVEIIVATPGRLNNLVQFGKINLSSVTYLVLDEVDLMLDNGFEHAIQSLMNEIRPDRQMVMISTTWPEGVRKLAQSYMKNPIQVYMGSLDLTAVHSVTQCIEVMDESEKEDRLIEFLLNMAPQDKVMVFVGKRSRADGISSELALKGINADVIHGGRAQDKRREALLNLELGYIRILIATDVASRGIVIKDITHIVNFDFPCNIEDYVHRVGRTGRAGKTGESITFFTRKDWSNARELIKILEEANQIVPDEIFKMADRFDAKKEKKGQDKRCGGGGGRGRGGRGRGWGDRRW